MVAHMEAIKGCTIPRHDTGLGLPKALFSPIEGTP